jgi:hypothetical protein
MCTWWWCVLVTVKQPAGKNKTQQNTLIDKAHGWQNPRIAVLRPTQTNIY